MTRSISFVADGDVRTLVTVTDNGDGTLTFSIEVIGNTVGDLRAVFFDLNAGFQVVEGDLYVVDGSATDVTDTASGEGSIDTLGKDANIKGSVSNELGDFDVGIEFGTSGMAADDIQSTSFTLASYSTELTLDMLNFADFGFRYTSVGEEGGDRTGSAKIGDTTGGVASDDLLVVTENEAGSVDLLANDAATGSVEPRTVVLQNANGVYGTLTIAADGTATLIADGAAADALDDGDSASFIVDYTVVDGDDRATAALAVTIEGVTDQTLPPLFTEGDDTVNFNTIAPGTFDPASFYDAGAGRDVVTLADPATAAGLGFDLGQIFHAGDGNDAVYGSTGADRVDLGAGSDAYVDLGGDDWVDGSDGVLSIHTGDGGDDTFIFGAGRNTLSYLNATDGVTVDLANGTAGGAAGNDTLIGDVTDLTGTNHGDVIYGASQNVASFPYINIYLWDGDDTFIGGGANEVLFLQVGTGTGHKTIDMGAGYDYMSFNFLTVGVTIDASAGSYSGWGTGTFTGVEEFQLGDGNDVFTGSDQRDVVRLRLGDDVVDGGAGNDVIYDGTGNSQISGGAGDDLILAELGSDSYDGGEGYDVLYLTQTSLSGGVVIDLGAGTLITADGVVSQVSGFERIRDGLGDDTLIGSAGDDFLQGESGDNMLTGGAGADTFWFAPANGRFGDNVITDFDGAGGDQLAIFGTGYTRSEAQVGADVLLTFTDASGATLGTITLLDTTLADIA